MAELLKCKLCGGIVASDAGKCPHCGTPDYEPDEHKQKIQMEYQQRKLEEERHLKSISISTKHTGKSCGGFVYHHCPVVCIDHQRVWNHNNKIKLTPGIHEVQIVSARDNEKLLCDPIRFSIQEDQKRVRISYKYRYASRIFISGVKTIVRDVEVKVD